MAKTTQITLPLSQLHVGSLGPFASNLLPPNLTGYVLDLTNDVTWPASGDVCTITVEQSNDSGNTWNLDATVTFSGGQWKNRQGQNVNTNAWSVSLNNQGSATRKVRVSLNVLQDCVLGATVGSV